MDMLAFLWRIPFPEPMGKAIKTFRECPRDSGSRSAS